MIEAGNERETLRGQLAASKAEAAGKEGELRRLQDRVNCLDERKDRDETTTKMLEEELRRMHEHEGVSNSKMARVRDEADAALMDVERLKRELKRSQQELSKQENEARTKREEVDRKSVLVDQLRNELRKMREELVVRSSETSQWEAEATNLSASNRRKEAEMEEERVALMREQERNMQLCDRKIDDLNETFEVGIYSNETRIP